MISVRDSTFAYEHGKFSSQRLEKVYQENGNPIEADIVKSMQNKIDFEGKIF